MRKKLDTRFPAARIKKIMQADEEVGKIALATPVLMSKALELFLQDLCDRTFEVMEHRGAKTLSASHLKQCLSRFPEYDFLKDIASRINDATADTPRGGVRGDVSGIGQSTSFGRGRRKQIDDEDPAVEDEDCFSPRAAVPKMRQPKQVLKVQKFCASSTEGRNGKSAEVCSSSRQEREKPELSASASDRKRQKSCAEELSEPVGMHKEMAGVTTHRMEEVSAAIKMESTTVSSLPGPVKHALDFDLNLDLNNSSVDEAKMAPFPTITSQQPVKSKSYDSDEDYDAEDDGG